ncbi:MAG: phage regulatory protein/antirepressor Ant [Cytophagaceae bacterium]|nr:MAG: phage regulatory protein/antirepressor Ant [Cytophagaceae bacterium]
MQLLRNPTEVTLLTMSSRELAELTEKDHKHVIRDIRTMLCELFKDGPDLGHVREDRDARGYTSMFYLNRELIDTLLTGYSVILRRKVIARWHELEAGVPLRIPQTFAQALRIAAEQAEQIEAQAAQLAVAAPKVQFVDSYVTSAGSKGFREVCKLLKANEHEFSAWLDSSRITYSLARERTAYQCHVDAGRFVTKAGTSSGTGHAYNQLKFTPKGVLWIAGLWAKHQIQRQGGTQ